MNRGVGQIVLGILCFILAIITITTTSQQPLAFFVFVWILAVAGVLLIIQGGYNIIERKNKWN